MSPPARRTGEGPGIGKRVDTAWGVTTGSVDGQTASARRRSAPTEAGARPRPVRPCRPPPRQAPTRRTPLAGTFSEARSSPRLRPPEAPRPRTQRGEGAATARGPTARSDGGQRRPPRTRHGGARRARTPRRQRAPGGPTGSPR